MFVRILAEILALNPALLERTWLPLTVTLTVGLAVVAYLYVQGDATPDDGDTTLQNPFHLLPAITFGFLYAVILLGATAAQSAFGDMGIYVSSFASGLADVDAITLSMANLSGPEGDVSLDTAARAIVLAAVANTLVKGGIVVATGHHALRRTVLPGVILLAATGVASLWLV